MHVTRVSLITAVILNPTTQIDKSIILVTNRNSRYKFLRINLCI